MWGNVKMRKRKNISKKLMAALLSLAMIFTMTSIGRISVAATGGLSADGVNIYADGNAIIIAQGSAANLTNIYMDSNADGVIDAGETAVDLSAIPNIDTTALTGNTTDGFNLSGFSYEIFGGSNTGTVNSTKITMLGGDVYYLMGGGNADSSNVTNGTNITISGGAITGRLVGGGNEGAVAGGTHVTISGGNVGYVYGASHWGGIVSGGSNINISGGRVQNVDGSGYASGMSGNGTSDNANVTITGGTINFDVHGGSYNATTTGNTTVNIEGGTINGSVYGGSSYAIIGGNASIAISGGMINGSVFGGGYYITSTIHGSTSITITGGTIAGSISKASVSSTPTLKINGGTIRGGINDGLVPKNTSDTIVYKTILTLNNASDAQTVSSLTIASVGSYSYGLKDLLTDFSGNIYVYFPADAITTQAIANSIVYFNQTGIKTLSDNSAVGILMQAFGFKTPNPANQSYSTTFSYTNAASGGEGTGAIS